MNLVPCRVCHCVLFYLEGFSKQVASLVGQLKSSVA